MSGLCCFFNSVVGFILWRVFYFVIDPLIKPTLCLMAVLSVAAVVYVFYWRVIDYYFAIQFYKK